MWTIEREELKAKYPRLIADIQRQHVMHPDVTVELIEKHKPVKGLTHTRSYFGIGTVGDIDVYYQYDMEYIITDPKRLPEIGRAIRCVTFYDTFQEYEVARITQLSAVNPDQQQGLNLN